MPCFVIFVSHLRSAGLNVPGYQNPTYCKVAINRISPVLTCDLFLAMQGEFYLLVLMLSRFRATETKIFVPGTVKVINLPDSF